jgi:hypothetical protein
MVSTVMSSVAPAPPPRPVACPAGGVSVTQHEGIPLLYLGGTFVGGWDFKAVQEQVQALSFCLNHQL